MLPLRLSYPEERALKPKDRFKECSDCPEIVVVPAGDFIMGSPANEEGRSDNEEPQHLVTIAHPFAVGRYAVTFDEWDACVDDGGCRGYRPNDRGWGRGRRPVIGIRWDDANAYVVWLSQKTSRPYRLPSEAEREYVTRAGTTTSFWMGASISSHDANYDGEFAFGGGPKGEFRKKTVPVDSFEPNPWGFYQMMGNIYEWTEDCYHKTYDGAPTDGSAWISGDCNRMVFRGGAWLLAPWHLRAASRGSVARESSHVVGGLRVARSLVQERFSGNQ